jgi:hypothetical protein
MNDAFAAILSQARAWFAETHAAGWLDEEDLTRLKNVEQATPADLFADEQARPLVVAFFGGTGAGKSSLLNRLAGETIAKTGVERPTSREVTVYVHEDVQLADLPDELPLDMVRIRRHRSDRHRETLWIDAPDIDSTEQSNRRAALAWLPHVDLVAYVVSPERYRDDVGWQVLRRRGQRHGWLFVMNRWDEGDPSQLDDFRRMLQDAGFEHPLLLPTCCIRHDNLPTPDAFDQIEQNLADLLQAHGVRELTRLGHRARLQELRAALQAAGRKLGDADSWNALRASSRAQWDRTAATIEEGATWSLQAVATRFAGRDRSLWEQLRRLAVAKATAQESQSTEEGSPGVTLLNELTGQLWDEWTQSKLQACLDATELAARRAHIATGRVSALGTAAAERLPDQVTQLLRDHLRAALARPGNVLTRSLRKVTGFLMAALPAAALMWVAWRVVQTYQSAGSADEFLGQRFAIHSALLVLLAWAVPFTIDRLLKPSIQRTALRALRAGLHSGLATIEEDLDAVLEQAAEEAEERRERLQIVLKQLAGLLVKPIDSRDPTLGRLLCQVPARASA